MLADVRFGTLRNLAVLRKNSVGALFTKIPVDVAVWYFGVDLDGR
jgi:hypothetical protein